MNFISLNIKRLINASDLTISDISAKIGMSRQSIYNMMDGKTEPNLKNLIKLSSVLDVPLIEFFREKQYYNPAEKFNVLGEKELSYKEKEDLLKAKDEQIRQLQEQIKFLQHIIEEKL